VTGDIDTGASVNVRITDGTDDVNGQTWPASMSHDSAGTYRATLNDSIGIEAGQSYVVIVSATGSGGEVGKWEINALAKARASIS
jgi:predicted RNA-binding protein with TRAM domain